MVISTGDILRRLSPYLKRKHPVDIIDLWPGAGLLSSKINDLLKPRRHVLLEPNVEGFGSILKPLAASKANYELLSIDPHTLDDWNDLMSKHLPEQGPSSCDTSGALAKNNTLLFLANPPPPVSKRDHYTPARWWSVMLEMCMYQAGIHNYGSVRMLATMPPTEAQSIIPRTVMDRKRTALLTESLALHAFEVAAPLDPGTWTMFKGWDLMLENAARVSERTAASKIEIPSGREPRPYTLAPESSEPGQKPTPHVPRIKVDLHDRILGAINSTEGTTDKDERKKRVRAFIQLNQDNRNTWNRLQIRDLKIQRDELMKSLSRTAADPNSNSKTMKTFTDRIAALNAEISKDFSSVHSQIHNGASSLHDDRRTALHTGNFDDALLLWDHRPFEPLHIESEELYPRESDRSVIYFEPDPNSPIMQRVKAIEPSKRADVVRLFEALILVFNNRSSMTVAELISLMLPHRPVNDIVRNIPSLATFAAKTPKADFDNQPKTVHPDAQGNLDPVSCFQENIDYDLSDVRIRCLAVTDLWDILLEYLKSAPDVSPVQFNRLLGGTLTSFRTGDHLVSHKRLH